MLEKNTLKERYGGVHKTCGNSREEGGRNLCEIPSLVGVWIDILELHNLQNRTKV